MPQVLSSLEVSEISLVDNPANAGPGIDPRTGRPIARARVALWKRDSDTKHTNHEGAKDGIQRDFEVGEDTRRNRRGGRGRKARRIAKRDGIGDDAALARAWNEHPEAQQRV